MNQQLTFAFPSEGKEDPTAAHKLLNLAQDLINFRVDIENALVYSYGSYTFDDIVTGILQGRFHFYPAAQSFLICELQQGPQYAIYHAFLAGGDLEELRALQEKLRPIAKTLGAKYSTINGRAGWVKALKEAGWEHRYSVLYTEV